MVGCRINGKPDLFGEYDFKEVDYLSLLSSSSVDFLENEMEGTKFLVEENLFKIELDDNIFEIIEPNYIKEDIPSNPGAMLDIRKILDGEAEYQYTIYSKEGEKTYKRLYTSQDSIWLASYVDNTADGSEIFLYVYQLSRVVE